MKQGIASLKKFAKQGGVLNYLGKQKTVNAPIKWKSSSKHPVAFLSYITKEEMDILIKANIYGSLKGKPNKGPFGLPSLQGSGSGSEGAGTADSGSSSQAGDAGYSDYSDASMGAPGPGAGAGQSSSSVSTGFDDFAAPTVESIDAFEAKQTEKQAQEEEDKSPQSARLSPMGIAAYNMSLMNPEKTATEKSIGFAFSPIGTTLATAYDSFARGPVTPGYESFDQDYGYNVQAQSTPSVNLGGGDLPYPFTKQNTQKSGVATLF
jgi:hypothetical protein